MNSKVYKVWQVNAYIKMCLGSEDIFHNIFVEGEISNFKYHSSGHMYFSLKDSKSSISCVCFKSSASRLRFLPENGMQVIVQGNISVFEKAGSYQIYVENMTPKGIGEMSLALDQLKEKLSAEGLFDLARKRPIPTHVKKIGVVTARTGAVIRDICHVAKLRNPYVKIVLYSVKVQGEEAAKEIIQGINFYNKYYPVDAIIVGRGGGSKEDLWCFNDEKLVRTIANSRIPIITAIGHETDTSLADYAGDKRAATPSQAAEFAVPELKTQLAVLDNLSRRLNKSYENHLSNNRYKLEYLVEKSILKDARLLIESKKNMLAEYEDRLAKAVKLYLDIKRQELDYRSGQLAAFNPLGVLKRGYTTVSQNGKFIPKLKDLNINKEFTISFQDGKCEAKIIKKDILLAKEK